MRWLSERALEHLAGAGRPPDLEGTKYRLVEELGRGGMGAVYVAEDLELQRRVALKVLRPELDSPEAAERLRREARVLARIEHSGIVPVHDVGLLADGRTFYVMKLVAGERLDAWCRGDPPLHERMRVLVRICDAVAAAHAQGVIHRDLKPENVMVGRFGEVLVLDWGVAKLRGEAEPAAEPDAEPTRSPPATAHGTVLGTPGYMAPEQARGEVERIDERADVYALGAILWFLLVGRPPAPTTAGSVVAEGDSPAAPLPPPRRVAPEVPRPLDAVCTRATAAEPGERYAGPAELAADLSRWLAQLPVSAYPESPWTRARRLAVKFRTPILLVAAYLVMRALLLGLLGR